MKTQFQYDNRKVTLEVPEEDFAEMIRRDYEMQLAEGIDPAEARRRSPQEILNERFNKPEYNNWQKHWRHLDDDAVPRRVDHKVGYLADDFDSNEEKYHFELDDVPDLEGMIREEEREQDRELRNWIRENLKQDYAEMLITIHLEGMTVTEYAIRIGEKRTAVSNRLQRAEKIFREIFSKTCHLTLSRGYIRED